MNYTKGRNECENCTELVRLKSLNADMYEALKKIAQCEKHIDGDVVDIARKALSKAEGRELS